MKDGIRLLACSTLAVALSFSAPSHLFADGIGTENFTPASGATSEELNITARPSEDAMATAMAAVTDEDADPFLYELNARSADSNRAAQVLAFSGADRFDVANAIARASFPSGASTAILAGSGGWPDALSSTSLAGALDCPILLTEWGNLTKSTLETFKQLGVKSVILVGGPNTISPRVESQLRSNGIAVQKRLGGANRYEVQMSIFNERSGNWNSDYLIVASGAKYPDALSASPLAYSYKIPIFLANESGSLSSSQLSSIKSLASNRSIKQIIIVGGPNSVSNQTASQLGAISSTVRLGGTTRYDASANFAQWAVSQGLLSWEGAAFATGETPYNALTGSSLQGKQHSVMLLIGSSISPTVSKFVTSGATSLKFFGGTDSIPDAWRASILSQMNLVTTYNANTSLSAFADKEVSRAGNRYSKAQILEYLDPSNHLYGTSQFYQFAELSKGYSGKISAKQIDAFVADICNQNGYNDSTLLGLGATIVEAAKTYNINEVYLLAHAILESGWGTSALSQGKVAGYEGYYNFFGIGAWDKDPSNGGGYLAKSMGWDTPQKGMLGAASWISKNYINGTDHQNTLYKMRWNTSRIWHQYATDRAWASNIARVMGQAYLYFGINASTSGLKFLYPVYR